MEQQTEQIIGADISQNKMDIRVIDKTTGEILDTKIFSNTSAGHNKIIKQYCSYQNVFVVLEATGNYHLKFVGQLLAQNVKLAVINPLVLKRFAQMKMIRTKTDKVDALTIARFGREQSPRPYEAPTQLQQELKSLLTVLNNLVKQRTQTKNLLHSQLLLPIPNNASNKTIKKVLFNLNKHIQAIETEINKIVENNFKDLKKLITSIKGIGDRTACGIIAYLGDLNSFESHKQLAAFMGICPALSSSGSSLNKTVGISKQGNTTLRTLFYLASLSAIRYNKSCKDLFVRLVQKGKRKKVAVIAVANKLIKQLYAIVTKKILYRDDYLHPIYA